MGFVVQSSKLAEGKFLLNLTRGKMEIIYKNIRSVFSHSAGCAMMFVGTFLKRIQCCHCNVVFHVTGPQITK